MTLICLASQKGSPGASAAALALAAAFKPGEGRRKLLLEADLSGGALAIRYRLPTEPGLVTLAAAARAGVAPQLVVGQAGPG
ncbi:MAG: carbon monoxide dehydrogenase maturation protein, partial [Actinomycetota bacterium]